MLCLSYSYIFSNYMMSSKQIAHNKHIWQMMNRGMDDVITELIFEGHEKVSHTTRDAEGSREY